MSAGKPFLELFNRPLAKLEFTVFATDYEYRGKMIHVGPTPQGSARALILPGHKHAVVVYANEHDLTRWRKELKRAAETSIFMANLEKAYPIRKPTGICLQLHFFFTRPRTVTRENHVVPPDLDKLVRACDALTGVVWQDDSQIIDLRARKEYGTPERVEITVSELAP